MNHHADWGPERDALLGRRISELGLRIEGSPVQGLVEELHRELDERGLAFKPPVYLSDEWGCPDGVPLIGVPFYLADRRLSRLEEEYAVEVEGEADAIKFLRHEAGHAFNYAYRLYERPDWRRVFGPYSRPYRERFRVDPYSRDYVRHILGWYAQKHPDEDFAETFAVWLTPGLDWRARYRGWPALAKLEYVDAVMRDIGRTPPPVHAEPLPDYLPVEAMQYTVGEHYTGWNEHLPADAEVFDADLQNIFATAEQAPDAERAAEFLRSHRRELVRRIAYWTGEATTVVRSLIDQLTERARVLDLRVHGLEASTLIELTAFGTAVIMNFRYTDALDGRSWKETP
ncbi:MAG TPA: putative zinc-binding metallopeptidase [Longimicrobiales bacterium]|nr:putative zinc-binding metallopeptidase [Longimicrobiales bacterium]